MPSAPPSLEPADSLYRGFPGFSDWGSLQPEGEDLWSRFAASLEERRKKSNPEVLKASVAVAIRAAALDTGALEGLYTVDRGFTMTVAVQGLAWEQMIEERGAGIRELFEAQLTAYELVLDAATRKLPITEAGIRALHETLCAPQQTYRVLTTAGWQEHELPKGQYKTQPNHVLLKDGTVHAYAPVDQVSAEMHRLVEQLRSSEFEAAHPVIQASWIHYAFVAIHPFADGNGRIARALASVYFYRCCSIPLLIFANQRLAYFGALHGADLGELPPLIGFFRDRGIDTMQLVTESLDTAGLPAMETLAERVKKNPGQLSNIRTRLLGEISERLNARVEELRLKSHLRSEINPTSPFSFAFLLGDRLGRAPEERLDVTVELGDLESPFPLQVWNGSNADGLEIRLQDVFPEFSEALGIRLDNWVRRQLARMLTSLESRIQRHSSETEG
ncbi:MAG TPA: Fic family protein [Thermoanaerobaculia bacterium]|nr:Fic family protein [Thermoanaerobaculia bacterium]